MTPENVNYVVARTLELVRDRLAARDPERDRRRLAEVELQVERAVELAVRMGGRVEAVERKLDALEAEKSEILARLDRAPALPSEAALREIARPRVLDYRGLLESSPEDGRRALRALLAGERMRVYSDTERGFRVEGLFRVPLTHEPPGDLSHSGRFDCVVAGGRFVRSPTRPCHRGCRSLGRRNPAAGDCRTARGAELRTWTPIQGLHLGSPPPGDPLAMPAVPATELGSGRRPLPAQGTVLMGIRDPDDEFQEPHGTLRRSAG